MLSPTIEPTKFTIEAIRVGVDHAVLTVTGDVDLVSVEQFRLHLSKLFSDGVRFLVVDLSAVSFLGSLGLEALVNAHDHTRAQRGWLILIEPPSIVARLLALVAPTRQFTVCPAVLRVRTRKVLDHVVLDRGTECQVGVRFRERRHANGSGSADIGFKAVGVGPFTRSIGGRRIDKICPERF